MSCEFCSNPANIDGLQDVLGEDASLRYCPICGDDINITYFIVKMEGVVKEAFEKATLDIARQSKENQTVEIDGEVLEFERLPSPKKKPPVKPKSMAVDLDNIDITKEMELLEKRGFNPVRAAIDETIRRHMKEKENE